MIRTLNTMSGSDEPDRPLAWPAAVMAFVFAAAFLATLHSLIPITRCP
jgi:hypothetical protein